MHPKQLKQEELSQMRQEAKDLQARLGYLNLQVSSYQKEIERIRVILEYRESMYLKLLEEARADNAPLPEPEVCMEPEA